MNSLLRAVLFPCLALAQIVLAQEPAPPLPPGAVLPPATPPPAAPAEPPKTITREQTIYVPFEKLEQVFGKEDRGVFLPYREFLEMWNKLNLPAELKKKEPPVEGVLAGATYSGKIDGDLATIHAKYSFEALKQGWSKVRLGAPNLSIAEAKSTATLSFADGGYEVIFPDKGSYTLDATIYGRVKRDPGVSSLHLQLPKTAVSQFELVIPEKGLDFTITPAAAYSAVENPDGTTRLMVYFGGSQDVNISWTRRAGETALKPLLFVEARTEVRVSAGAVRTDTLLNYRILRAGVDALDVLVPGSDQVLSVDGQNIREWTLQPGAAAGQPQKVHIVLHTSARENYALRVKTERALGALPQKAALPVVQADGVERQAGVLALFVDPELVAETSDLQELTQQSAAGVKDAAGLLGEFRYLRLPYAGTVAVSEAKPQIDVASETLVTMEPDLLKLRTKFDYDVKKAGIFATQIELPAGFTRAEATGEQIENATVQKAGGKDVLQIKFSGRRIGPYSFTVTSEVPREKPDAALTVPVFRIPGAERHEAKVGVAIHVSLKANTTDRGDLREEDVRTLSDLPVEHPETTPLTLGFRYRGDAKPAQVQFELRKPRVSVEVAALLEVRETLLRHVWTLQYSVEYAGVNEFSVEVPTAIADDLQIEGPNIKERTRTDLKDAKGEATGRSVWRVILQEKVLGQYSLQLTHDTPRGEQKPGQIARVTLEEIRPLNVFRETGQIAVVKDGNLEFAKTDAKGLELIDPKELNPVLQTGGVFLSYKYAAHPISLRLDVSKNMYLDVPAAVVTDAILTSVIAEDEAETTEVIYWVKNNAQQFFSIQLPAKGGVGAKLLSDAFVDGEPQQPSRRPDRNELLIRLPARQQSTDAFPVRFVYEVPSSHPGRRMGWHGHLELEPPQLGGVGVLRSKWTLFLPTEHRYVHFSGSMRAEGNPRGWDSFWRLFGFFVPKVGPQGPIQYTSPARDPDSVPAPKRPGFDTQIHREGIQVTLRRLDAPSEIHVAYRSKGYAATVEALAFLLAFGFGVRLLWAPCRARFTYFAVVGLGALIIGGAVDPRGARFWETIYLGVFLAVIVWFVCGCLKTVKRFFQWLRNCFRPSSKPPQPPTPPSSPGAPGSTTPPSGGTPGSTGSGGSDTGSGGSSGWRGADVAGSGGGAVPEASAAAAPAATAVSSEASAEGSNVPAASTPGGDPIALSIPPVSTATTAPQPEQRTTPTPPIPSTLANPPHKGKKGKS